MNICGEYTMADLPKCIEKDKLLSSCTWLGVGGACDWFAEPHDKASLCEVLSYFDGSCAVQVLGAGSNLLVRDGGVKGLVIKLGTAWHYGKIIDEDEGIMEFGGITPLMKAAKTAASYGLSGLEFMVGIPGSIGGAVRMNAGCFGGETADCLESIHTIDFGGKEHHFSKSDLVYGYREASLNPDHIVLSARFRLIKQDASMVQSKTKAIMSERKMRQPHGVKTGGSTFRNPPEASAWSLIDSVGGRGKIRGGAMFSEKHCNFLINTGRARARDLEELAEEVRQKVREQKGIDLQWEIIRWGE